MGNEQPMDPTPEEQFVQIPLHIDHDQTTPNNQTSNLNRRRYYNWIFIIICIILTVTGLSFVRLLENFYFLHRNRSRRYSFWTQALLQVIGFPILYIPFFLLLLFSSTRRKQLLITSNGISRTQLSAIFFSIGVYMFTQASVSNGVHHIPFRVFTLIYTTQLLFTPILSLFLNKTKLNRWIIISLVFAILSGAFTLYTFSAGSPIYDPAKKLNPRGIVLALCAAVFFSILLCQIRSVFEELFEACNEPTNRNQQPSFVVVYELLIYSSLVASIIAIAAVFISGEHKYLRREIHGFLKGESDYLRAIIGQVVAWQVYWVGIVGLVFSVSAVFSNVISVCAWPVVSLLVVFFYKEYGDYDVLRGTALATAALSVVSYFYIIFKEMTEDDGDSDEAAAS